MENFIQSLIPWFTVHGIKIIGIIVGAFIFVKIGKIFVDRIVRKIIVSDHFLSKEAERKREDTLISIFANVLKIIIWIIALMMILAEFGVNIGPIIAGAGIVGLAIGFGAQNLIKNFISGFFIILENQYRVDDVVCLDNTCGLVEDITLRMTVLRDLDGTVHHIPNGEVVKASNKSKIFSRVNLDIGISYDSNLEKVIKVVNKVGQGLAKDPNWKDAIIEPPQFLRVNDFGDSAIEIKILGDTKPLKQWDVMGELRKRLKIAFDKAGIEIPFPQRVIHQKK
jgi:small conductance mechanosensitive channel